MFLSNRGSFRPETSGAYTLRRRGRRRPKSGSAIGACAVARLAGSGGPIGDYYGSANNVGAALHQVHGVGEVGPVEVAGERLDDGAGLEAGHVRDGELGPVGKLQGDHIARLDARIHEPRRQAGRRVVHLAVGHATALVVGDVLFAGVRPRLALPDVTDGFARPVPLLVILFLLLLVDLEIGDHRPSFLKNLKPFCHGSARPPAGGTPVIECFRRYPEEIHAFSIQRYFSDRKPELRKDNRNN